ncbi:hypothetical protein ACLQ29_01405 [Micromonospora sp. DT228]|uniref:hypothetical protein n=1 Tax=Micromonospora sp. DT228 TaxID=3393443 RepID=UPI003CF62777
MTSPAEPASADAAQARQLTKPLRELAALALLGANAVFLFVGLLRWIAPDGSFTDRSGSAFGTFVGLAAVGLPLLAVLLATHISPVVPKAKLITQVALGEYGVSAIFGTLTLLIWTVGQLAEGEVLDALLGVLTRFAWMVIFAVAAWVVYTIWRAHYYVPRPKPQPGVYGQPQQPGWPQQQGGWPTPGQPAGQPQGGWPAPGQPGGYPADQFAGQYAQPSPPFQAPQSAPPHPQSAPPFQAAPQSAPPFQAAPQSAPPFQAAPQSAPPFQAAPQSAPPFAQSAPPVNPAPSAPAGPPFGQPPSADPTQAIPRQSAEPTQAIPRPADAAAADPTQAIRRPADPAAADPTQAIRRPADPDEDRTQHIKPDQPR